MSSPALVAQANRTSSEADIRALAAAKIAAKRAYDALAMVNTTGKTDEQLADMEIERARAHKAYWDASQAFQRAV